MKYSFDIPPLHRLRTLEKGFSTSEVAKLMNRSQKWVNDHKNEFIQIENGRNLKFEMASVLEYHFKNQ